MNVYQKVTDAVIEQLRGGVIPWEKPYVCGAGSARAINYVSRRPYSLLNAILLGRPGEYLTFNQIQNLGGHVREGAKARFVVFFKIVEKTTVVDGETVEKGFPLLRYYNVFHVDDVEGVEPRLEPAPVVAGASSISCADDFIGGYLRREGLNLAVCDGGADASLVGGTLSVPAMSRFRSTEMYYGTVLKLLIRSTGVRLGRDMDEASTGAFSREDLVDTMGAMMAARRLGLNNLQTESNDVAYIQKWIDAMSADANMIVWASSRAEKAVEYLFQENNLAQAA